MDHDINNQQMLSAGAFYSKHSEVGDGWQPISSAPRDGTAIEVRCTYGVAPWYGLFRWTDKMTFKSQDGTMHEMTGSPRWAKVGDDSSGFEEGPTFSWRPFDGDTAHYTDPTGGAQDSMAYWRGAVAAKYGLPLNAFEAQTKKNVERHQKSPEPPRKKFLGIF